MKISPINNNIYQLRNQSYAKKMNTSNVNFNGKIGALAGGLAATGVVITLATGGMAAPLTGLFYLFGASATTASLGGAAATIGAGAYLGSKAEDTTKASE